MAKSDFLSWDGDLDLEYLLGDFTEYSESEDFSDEFDEVETKRPRASKSSQHLDPKLACYVCPECNKSLKTIAGFRGHTSKQHGKTNLKASEHRSTSIKDIGLQKSPSSNTKSGVLSEEDFLTIFPKAYQSTLDNILCDFEDSAEFNLTNLVHVARTGSTILNFYKDFFEDIFVTSKCSTSTSSDREELFNKLHIKRIDQNLSHKCHDLFQDIDPSLEKSSIQHFSQLVLLDLIGEICKEQTQLVVKKTEHNAKSLTDNDQTVLYYISGFIIRALRKRYSRCRNTEKSQCCHAFVSTSSSKEKTFLKKFHKMITMKDRGGLQKPSSDFFLLVRECEVVTRSLVDTDKLGANSLLLSPLKEKTIQSFMVQHYAKSVLSGVPENVFDSVLEDIIKVFLTVRGHAVVRVERNKLRMKTKGDSSKRKSSKQSSSLRQTLKDISTVIE
ncbi:uncharacterized protein LOC117316933 [Pecten maximus]|uniref:uncharacterized protein LOC117316933 n=1 Tax=Pecten maximus TaxID=6579 RepID=UPI001459088D|nr:uncharacterized protein LOC117316933 [Pecten maximus]